MAQRSNFAFVWDSLRSPHNSTLVLNGMKRFIRVLILLLATWPCFAEEVEYRPGGQRFEKTWLKFYAGDHEPELSDPLISAGPRMTKAICEAVSHPDMKLRRYALGALGFIGDKRAIPTLERILKNKEEIYYFRGDALNAIYQLDKRLGAKYSKQFSSEHEYLKMIADAIEKGEKWLTTRPKH